MTAGDGVEPVARFRQRVGRGPAGAVTLPLGGGGAGVALSPDCRARTRGLINSRGSSGVRFDGDAEGDVGNPVWRSIVAGASGFAGKPVCVRTVSSRRVTPGVVPETAPPGVAPLVAPVPMPLPVPTPPVTPAGTSRSLWAKTGAATATTPSKITKKSRMVDLPETLPPGRRRVRHNDVAAR